MSVGNASLTEQAHYHVFLSHNGADKSLVEALANELENRGLSCWLDKWNLIPGKPWQPAIEEALAQCGICLVFFGPHGLGPWHNEEMRLALQRRVTSMERKLRVLPVILPGGQRAKESQLMMLMPCIGCCAASKASHLGVNREQQFGQVNALTSD